MGGRGTSSGISTNSITISNGIKREMLSKGLNSKFKGVQRDAKAGTGSFTYKDARAIGSADALKMDILRVHENSNNTLVEGIIRGKHVFYANKNSDSTIQKIKNNIDKKKQKTNPRFAGKTGNPNHKHLRQMEEKPRQKF